MKAVIMAGGFGTRLRPLTLGIPKPMVPLGGPPLMEQVIRLLVRHGLTEIIALLYFQAESVINYFGDGKKFGARIEYLLATDDYGTAGSVKNAESKLTDRFLVISGDVYTNIDLSEAVRHHIARRALASIVLTSLENPLPYGIVITDQQGKITRFLEKPTWGQVFSDTVNTGIYILEKEVLERIPPRTFFDFSQNLFPSLLAAQSPLYGYVASGYWRDVGNLDQYFQVHRDLIAGKVALDFNLDHLDRPEARLFVGSQIKVDPSAEFSGVVIIQDNCTIGAGAKIANSVIGKGTKIAPEATVSGSIVWSNCAIGQRATLLECIVCNDSRIGAEATVQENAIISEHCQIGQRATIISGVKVWPSKTVEEAAVLNASLVWGAAWNRELFFDAKVSGLANMELTPEFAVKLGAALGAFLGEGATVITSRDASKVSRMINRAMICGLLATGVNVQDLRTMPIPVVRYELKSGRERGGIHVRHSPQDRRLLDIVFFDSGGQDLPTAKTRAVERLFLQEDFRRATLETIGHLDFPVRVLETYREDFLSRIDSELIQQARPKVVIDYSYGGASEVFPSIIGALGIDAISLNAYVDPRYLPVRSESFNFSSARPEMSETEPTLIQLSAIVRSLKADLGFHLDPEAERLTLIDETGEIISGNRLLLFMLNLYLRCCQTKSIAVPVVASMATEETASLYGTRVVRVRNDHLGMMEAVSQKQVDFVGGTRGGFIFSDFQPGVDAMFATVKVLEMLARVGKRPAEIKKELKNYPLLADEVPCDWGKKGTVMRHLMNHSSGKNRELIDGVRIIEEGAWVLVTPDRRKASFNIFVEATDQAKALALLAEYRTNVEKWQVDNRVGGGD